MKLKIFTIFHRAIDERLILSLLSQTEIETYFTLYGVNESVLRKYITTLDGVSREADAKIPNLMLEYRLPWHDPSIQSNGFLEASCYVHLYQNEVHKLFDYLGITQYDMRWTAGSVEILRGLVDSTSLDHRTVYGISVGKLMDSGKQYHKLAFPEHFDWLYLLQSYNRFFQRNWDEVVLVNKPLTLYQTYLLPQKQFIALAAWLSVLVKQVYPWANQPPYPTHWGLLSGLAERAEAVFVAARIAEGAIQFKPWHLQHDESIAEELNVSKDHYGEPSL